jgi:zinc transport system substrate-binding protein
MLERILLALALCIFATLLARAEEPPRVVVSIAPVHSLVAAVMSGVARPKLLIPAGASPHTFALKPSHVRRLHTADLVIWIGKSLELFLAKPLATLEQGTARMTVADLPGIKLLNLRGRGDWSKAAHEAGAHAIDPHLWLDPDNARVIVTEVAQRLAQIDAANARRYEVNAKRAVRRLDRLDARLERRLAAVEELSYVVFHDAYQYFEKHYHLSPVGSIVTDPEISPGVRSIIEIRDRIEATDARCVFREPQFKSDLVNTVVEGTGARRGVLDPEGTGVPPGPNAYFILMMRLADSLAGCLKPR